MSRYLLFLIFYLLSSIVSASPLTEGNIPEPLKSWINWVLQDEKQYQCPFFYNDFQNKRCAWPGDMSLDLKSRQGQFVSQWQVYKESWITLPGNKDFWPQTVTVNDKPALVMNHRGKARIKLAAGDYKIKGIFFWDRIPESLTIPENTALFSLAINGKNIRYPIIKNDRIWLKESDVGNKKPKSIENKLDIQVFRKVYDDVPLQLITHLILEVSGDQREITLPYALLTGFIPVYLDSPLPARIESDGRLLVQVRPGRWHIELNARYPKPLTELKFNVNDKHWPQSEIWSFKALPYLRVVEINNLKSIDPNQTNNPKPWKNLPAYQLMQGDSMLFKVIRRGDAEPEPNQLSLKRKLWLDFSGDAYTVSDSISGNMTKGWRLDALPETQVGQVKLNGQNQLVTTSASSNMQGVEVRQGQINLQADSRIKGNISSISAVGWKQNFHQLRAELNIPPGWRLLAATGVDNVPDSWISRWTLLDLFLLLIAALAISKLWTVYWGVFSLIVLGLCWHEPGAPHFIWLNILAAIALIRVLPPGKFQWLVKSYRYICWLALVIIVIPFMVSQVRTGLYPQLERQTLRTALSYPQVSSIQSMEQGLMEEDKEAVMSRAPAKMRKLVSPESIESVRGLRKSKPKRIIHQRIDPDANIQTGPGLPKWQWEKIHLSWTGSVDEQQQIKLWYLSPRISMLLNFSRVILVLILSFLMLDLVNKNIKFSLPALSWIFLIPLLSIPVEDAHADFPDSKLLDDLKTRLLEAPDCLPNCAQISQMDLSINQQNLTIKLLVHTQIPTAIPLPAQFKQWVPNKVKINGSDAQGLIRTKQGLIWLSLEKGQHNIQLLGINPALNKFSLPLPLKPHNTKVVAKGWNIEGIHEHGRTDNQLLFNRLKTVQEQKDAKQKLEPGTLPPFIRIERTFHLGLDWRITTRVLRTVNNDSALAIKFPLLKGESVTSANVRVKNQHVLINMSSREQSWQWESILEKTAPIQLIAANTYQWNEVWRADVSPIWHLETAGISVIHHQDNGRWLPEWRPWPGEKVSLSITRPKAVRGSTLTIDRTELQVKLGKRSTEAELKLIIRSSKGTQHTLTLPEQIQLQTVKINGVTQPVRQKERQVTLPIKPGTQNVTLLWREKQQQNSFFTSPLVKLEVNSVNNHLKLKLGQDRWVLFTSGPKFGPAVLFWGVLIVIVLLSIGLGKISITPLKHWQWFLLLIGLSQIPVESALVVVIWLITLGLRAKKQPADYRYFNLMQVVLGLLTVFSIILLFIAVQQGLLGSPNMQIAGNQSSAFNLNWYQDRSQELLPTASIVSVPLMSYRIMMLLWSLWLAVSLLNWLKWGWRCFSSNGFWKKKEIIETS